MTGPDEPRELLAGERTTREIDRWLRQFEHMDEERARFVRAMHATIDPALRLDAGQIVITLLAIADHPAFRYVGQALVEVAIAVASDVAIEVAVDDLGRDLERL